VKKEAMSANFLSNISIIVSFLVPHIVAQYGNG